MVSIKFVGAMKLEGAAERIHTDLVYARDEAVSKVVWHGVSYEADPINTYEIYTITGTLDTHTLVEDPAKWGSSLVINVEDKYGVKIDGVDFDGGNKVEFDPLGVPYEEKGGVELTAQGSIVISYSGETKTIYVTPQTGRIRIQ